jgi:ubiquinone/menaquinone biosynthesis C-methylase UbiE
MEDDYIKINKASWNNKVDIHLSSEFYNQAGFLQGQTSLKEIELNLLGNIEGKSVLHLQCHFGQDSISLAKMGAKVTAIDFSEKAIEKGKEIAAQMNVDVEFICCDLYNLNSFLNKEFDIVFTSYGTIGWLPDLDKWASIINSFVKPDGKFVFVEFHPVVWMFDDQFEKVGYDYFNSGPIVEEYLGTYADKAADLKQSYVMWNHGLNEVFKALKNNHLQVDDFDEYDYSPYSCFLNTIEFEPGKFRIKKLEHKIPMVYSITAVKK